MAANQSPGSLLQERVAAIGGRFAIDGSFLSGEEIQTGLINSTYRATYLHPDGSRRRYILQSINREVFKDPVAVMRNVERVTTHIQARLADRESDHGGQTLTLFPARDGGSWTCDESGALWRCYNHIEGCVTHDIVETPRQAYEAARAFGTFQHLVSDLDPGSLIETIPDFHHTRKRFARLMETAAADPAGRIKEVEPELDFIRRRETLAGSLLDLADAGLIPLRITHNDTKINNVMMDSVTDEAVCVIDLDTVMPGLSLYDFGDLLRSATSPAAEDETDLSKVSMRMHVFEALVDGYLAGAGDFLSETELDHLVTAGKVITLELAMRFLTDHLAGDLYFKTSRPGHNLDRCRTQLQLVRSIEEQERSMETFISKARRR